MTFEKASSLGYSGKCRLKVKTSCKGKGGREGEKEGKVRADKAPPQVRHPGVSSLVGKHWLSVGTEVFIAPQIPQHGLFQLLHGKTIPHPPYSCL